jgi:hypothetical protein
MGIYPIPHLQHPIGKCHEECPCPDGVAPSPAPSPSPQPRPPFGRIGDRNQVGSPTLPVNLQQNLPPRPSVVSMLAGPQTKQQPPPKQNTLGGSIEDFLDNYLKEL